MAGLITIVGGGLAGLSCGVGLRKRGIPVELHEAGNYPRHRVCGEFISGVSEETLVQLGIQDCFQGAAMLKTMAWFGRTRCLLKTTLPKPARGISRHQLDLRLRDALSAQGGEIHENSRVQETPREGLVWSAGRERRSSRLVGLKAHFQGMPLQADLEMHIGRGGYLGLCRVEEGLVNACGLFPTTAVQGHGGRGKAGALLAAVETCRMSSELIKRLKEANLRQGSVLGVAGFRTGWQGDTHCGVRIGDSVAMIPPFTGNGMSMAFEGARMAVDELTAYSHGRRTWEETGRNLKKSLDQSFRRRMFLSSILHPFLTHRAGQSLLAACAVAGILPVGHVFSVLRSS